MVAREALHLDGVQAALDVLRYLAPAEKAVLVQARAAITLADKGVKLAEHELLRQ